MLSSFLNTRISRRFGALSAVVLAVLFVAARPAYSQMSIYSFTNGTGNQNDMTGASQAIGAGQDDVGSGAFSIGFTFVLDGTSYTTFGLSSNGLMRLGAGAGADCCQYYMNGLPEYASICPWQSDLTTGTDAGVYYLTSGAAPFRVLTAEWRCNHYANFTTYGTVMQVRLYETSGRIEFWYGANSMSGYTGSIGAAVNSGNYACISNNAVSYTSAAYTVFPASGTLYTLNPVLNDVGADSLWTLPTRAGNAYPVGSTVSISARFRNYGANLRQNVPVQADVYYNSGATPIASLSGTAFPVSVGQFGTSIVAFTGSISTPQTNNTGQYLVRVYPKPLTPSPTVTLNAYVDQDKTNDTLVTSFFVTKANDVMAYQILQPYSNIPPLFYQYPVGSSVPIEIRFLNIGTNPQVNVPVGYNIYNSTGAIVASGTGTVLGTWLPISFRDVVFTGWSPTAPGRYYMRAFTLMTGDEQPQNDTVPAWSATSFGYPFDVAYEIEVQAAAVSALTAPQPNQCFPIGKPVAIKAVFLNDGVSDATNIPANVTITNSSGQIVYNRNVTILGIVARTGPGAPGQTLQQFPDFVPPAAGNYSITASASYPNDPVAANNAVTWNMCVKQPLIGTIRVGIGERYSTVQEAWDSVSFYGVSGAVTFELVDDSYLVDMSAGTVNPKVPALDLRRQVIGVGPNSPITFRPNPGKTMVTINMKSASGIGMWYGQAPVLTAPYDTMNPTGYVVWDGGASKAMTFTYENTSTNPGDGFQGYTRSIPFYFGRGSSNYTIKNCRIYPFNTASGKNAYLTIPMPTYNQSFNQFLFASDYTIQISAAILLRNSLRPQTGITVSTGNRKSDAVGQALNTVDTLRNQNNVFDGNMIDGFGYGIASIGAGPLYSVGQGRYVEYNNQNNTFNNNTITNSTRAGIMLVWEKGSQIIGNTVRGVDNSSVTGPPANVAGIWASSGGNTLNNRGYSTDLRIERNQVSRVFAATGNAAGIVVETAENVFVSPSNQTIRFPTNGATNIQIWNNMVWNYHGQIPIGPPIYSVGIGFTPDAATRLDFVATGNKVQNNSILNQISGNTQEFGVLVQRAGVAVTNNIIALGSTASTNPTALFTYTMDQLNTVPSDYNLFYVPNGYIGQILNLSAQGFDIPSPPAAKTLEEWQYVSKQNASSLSGNIMSEFLSINPGSEDLHLNSTVVGGLASNRGTPVTGLTIDLDGDQRSPAGSTNGRPDIGADEYNGALYNYDLASTAILAPVGFQAVSGQYSDGEYIMTDSLVPMSGRVRNYGGQPLLNNQVTMSVERWTGSAWVATGVSVVRPVAVNLASTLDVSFGTFMPLTLREYGQNDPFYGLNPNVTPLFRFSMSTAGVDQNPGNNLYQKMVRFYVQRSTRKTLVAVKYWAPATAPASIGNAVDLGNKLNADTVSSALRLGGWDRADGVGPEDFDLFERDKWPTYSDNFKPWKTVIWAQGEEAQGVDPWERAGLKEMLDSRDLYNRSNLLIAGQEVARKHDVALTATNGALADQDFVNNYLRTQYRGNTNPSIYDGLRIQGVKVSPGVFELVNSTGVAGDAGPLVGIVRATTGNGVAYPAQKYVDQLSVTPDTASGVATFAAIKNSVYYAIDWRHFKRLAVDGRGGAMRIAKSALDLFEQNKGVLPIHLVNFDAFQSSPTAVTVSWQTSSEVDVAGMEIERAEVVSTTGTDVQTGAFRMVDKRNSAGSALSGSKYSVVDQGVEQGRTYVYRLVSVGLDGSRVNEGEKEVRVTGQAGTSTMELSVVPNPVIRGGDLTISYRVGAGEKVRVILYDELGGQVSVVKDGVEATGAGSSTVKSLPSGTYTVVVESQGGERVIEKVVVQK